MTSLALRATLLAAGLLLLQALTLWWMGQPPICECGYIKLWEGVVSSSGNSQHLFDWYTFSHVIHGFAFYALTWLLFPRLPLMQRFLIALGIEVAWEILENTPMVIEHYRQQALAQGYVGDSISNSISDSVAMIAGFIFAFRYPWQLTLSLAIFLELFVGYSIRDNLTFNILNLIHQFPAVSKWQSGG